VALGARHASNVSTVLHATRSVPARALHAALNVVDVPMRALQRLVGVPRIGWMFVAPNLLILGLFTFLPIIIDFAFAQGDTYTSQMRQWAEIIRDAVRVGHAPPDAPTFADGLAVSRVMDRLQQNALHAEERRGEERT